MHQGVTIMKARLVCRLKRCSQASWAVGMLPITSLCLLILAGNAGGQQSAKPEKPTTSSESDVRVQEELKNLQAAVAKLHRELKQLRAKIKTAQHRQEEMTQKYVKSFTATYLDSVLQRERADAANMLSKSLRADLGSAERQQEYAGPLGIAGKG